MLLRALIYTGAFCSERSLIGGWVKSHMQNYSPPYFSKCLPVVISLQFPSISLHTHILQIMFKVNNNKNTIIITHFRRQPFSHATISPFYFVSELFLYSLLARLSIQHGYIKITTRLHIPFKKYHEVFLCKSLRNWKYHRTNVLFPKILVLVPNQ